MSSRYCFISRSMCSGLLPFFVWFSIFSTVLVLVPCAVLGGVGEVGLAGVEPDTFVGIGLRLLDRFPSEDS